jgi:hypothetical protein
MFQLFASHHQTEEVKFFGLMMTDSTAVGMLPDHHAVCHNIQPPPFSASHDIGHHPSMLISDSLMMAF